MLKRSYAEQQFSDVAELINFARQLERELATARESLRLALLVKHDQETTPIITVSEELREEYELDCRNRIRDMKGQ